MINETLSTINYPRKKGCSYTITIPKYLIKAGVIDPNEKIKVYFVKLKKAKRGNKNDI